MGRKRPDAGDLLEIHLRELGRTFVREFKFSSERRWRSDFLIYPEELGLVGVLIEIEGAVWTRGRHTRGAGYLADLEKYRVASALGYKIFRFATSEVLDGTAKKFIEEWA